MEPTPFKLEAKFSPSGDQPQAIEKLIEGLNDGFAHQTLLGVTGSGKSVGYNEPLLIAEAKSGRIVTRLVAAGPFIDGLMRSNGLESDTDTEKHSVLDRGFATPAYDPRCGTTAWYPVAALLRHRAPPQIFRLATRCGREIEVTGDHNFWVLRAGVPTLIKSEEALPTDFLPVPDIVTDPGESIDSIDILPYLADTGLSVFAEEPILDYVAASGTDGFVAAMREAGVRPRGKLCAIQNGARGRGVKVRHFLSLLQKTNGLDGRFATTAITVGGKREHHRLPAQLKLSDSTLSLFGFYVAEGNSQSRYFTLANRHPAIR